MDFFENLSYFLSNYMRGALWFYLPLVFGILGLWLGYHLWARYIEQLELGLGSANRLRKNNDNLSRRIRDFKREDTKEEAPIVLDKSRKAPTAKAKKKDELIAKDAMEEQVKTITLQAPSKPLSRKTGAIPNITPKAGQVAEDFFEDPVEDDEEDIEPLTRLLEKGDSEKNPQSLFHEGDISPVPAHEEKLPSNKLKNDEADRLAGTAKEQAKPESIAPATSDKSSSAPKSPTEQISLSELRDVAEGIDQSQFGVEPEKPSLNSYSNAKARYPGETTIVKHDLGVTFAGQPSWKDDLTEINGVGDELEQKLNGLGIFRFHQVGDWNIYNVWAFNKRLSFSSRIEREGWVEQAARLARANPRPSDLAASAVVEKATENAPQADTPSPFTGLKKGAAQTYTEAEFKLSPEQLVETVFKGEKVEADPTYGVIYLTAPSPVDDLKEIWGVGSLLEKKLNEAGIYRFIQIATWSSEAVDAFQERLHFPERIRRDDWVRQARELVAEQ